jgi:hypothetical protein
MPSQRQWLQMLTTHLIERERTLISWQQLIGEVIPPNRRHSFQSIVKESWQNAESLSILEQESLVSIFRTNGQFVRWWSKGACPLPPALSAAEPQPVVDTSSWSLPQLSTRYSLCNFLRLHPDDLDWLTSPRYHHYHEQWLPKRHSGRRLLESPKPLLKQTQRHLLERLLNLVPPHEAAIGFRPGYSVLDFAAPHCNQELVLKMDLADFFPSLGRPRIKRTFMSLGYRESIANSLASLTTARCQKKDLSSSESLLYHRKHLPQGAPTSPALANLAVFRLDCRLTGLARAVGARYTRYADDLLFSGSTELARVVARFEVKVMAIALEEGLTINPRKTRTMPRSQRQAAAGLTLNEKINIKRSDYDTLKAILHNCIQHGPSSQNHQDHPRFADHLKGRIEWLALIHPGRGEKLRSLYFNINWE